MADKNYLNLSGLSNFLDNLKNLFATKTDVDEIISEHTHSYDDLRNKPFYEGADYSSILVGGELSANFYKWGGGVYGAAVTDAPKTFIQNTSYKVIWDDFEYTLTSIFSGNNEAGNPITSLGAPYGNYSTYPFGIDSYKNASGVNEFSIHTNSSNASHTIDILELGSSFVTLDEKFIPDSIARVSDIDAELNNINNSINNIPATYETKTDASSKLTEAKTHTDTIASGKADKEHDHAIADVTGLQTALDGKAASSHGTHVTYSTTAPVMDGTASVGSASTVARSDHKHPTDTSRASKTEFDTHASNTIVHITGTERTNWNAAKTHADSAHAPSNAEKNQNAFSNVKVGNTTIAADSVTDTITLEAGTNVTITSDSENDKVTITAKDTTYSAGTGISLSGTQFSNSGVRAVATGSANGTVSVNTNGTSADVAVKGLGSAAYTASTAYDAYGAASNALSSAKTYTDEKVAALVNGAPETLNTLDEIAAALNDNADIVDVLNESIGKKQDTVTGGATTITLNNLTTNRALISNGSGKVAVSEITSTELGYLGGVSSNVQTQLDGKAPSSHNHNASNINAGTLSSDRLPTVPIDKGGTGATTASGALTNLGLTATAAELNKMDGVTATTAEINILDGITATTAELNCMDGVSGNVQTQLNNKMDKANPTGTGHLSINRKEGTTVGDYSVTLGSDNEASGQYSYAEGVSNKATDYAAHAEGDRTTASSTGAHAEGQSTIASGLQAHAEGRGSVASASGSHAEGMGTTASGTGSHSEGTGTKAEGMYCHAEGASTVAKGYQTHAEGSGTIASGSDQHVQGRYNIEAPYQFAHIVGNGSSDTARSNMHTLDWQGNAWYSGDVLIGGTSMTSGSSRATTEADHNWNLIYDSDAITSAVNSFANINTSGYKNFMVAVSCINNGNPSTRAGVVIFKATNGTIYQFPVWGNLFSASNVGCGGMAEFKFIDGYIVCPNANRVISNSNFLKNTEGGTAVNLIGQGGGIMKCTNAISTITVSSLDQNSSYYFGVGSRLMIWGWGC